MALSNRFGYFFPFGSFVNTQCFSGGLPLVVIGRPCEYGAMDQKPRPLISKA